MQKQLGTENCLSSLDVSEMFVSRVSSMYIYIMHYLNFFLSCSIKNLTLVSLSRLFTIKSDVNFPFYTSQKEIFLAVGDTLQEVIILQNENKMKAAADKNAKISLPKAFQTNKDQPKSLAVKVAFHSRKFEFKVFSNIHLNDHNF